MQIGVADSKYVVMDEISITMQTCNATALFNAR